VPNTAMDVLLSGRFNRFTDTRDSREDALEVRHLGPQPVSSRSRKAVIARPATLSRRAPRRAHPSLCQNPLERAGYRETSSTVRTSSEIS